MAEIGRVIHSGIVVDLIYTLDTEIVDLLSLDEDCNDVFRHLKPGDQLTLEFFNGRREDIQVDQIFFGQFMACRGILVG